MSIADEFGEWQQQNQPEKPLWERAKDDIVNTVSNYITGAKQGSQEVDRQNQQLDSMIAKNEDGTPQTDESGSIVYNQGVNQQQFDDVVGQRNKALTTYNQETTKPAIMTVAPLISPTFAMAMLGTDLAPVAQQKYDETGSPLEALKSVTVQPAIDMYYDPNLSQNFHDRPVSTLASGAMALGQAVLPLVGARYGVKKAGALKDDLVAHVEKQLDTITDNPPLQNTGLRGLDALDQIDSPTRGFRPATPAEMEQAKTQAVQEFGDMLNNIKQQKIDESYTVNNGFESFVNAISGQESGGDYSAVNGRTGASGKFQIMPDNWEPWSKEAGLPEGSEMTPQNQEIVARHMLKQLYDNYGARGAAEAWYGGEGAIDWSENAKNRPQGNGNEPSINEYANSVLSRMDNNPVKSSVFDQEPQPRFTTESVGDLPPMALEDQMTPLMQTLEQIKGQKFDEANGQAYSDFMQRQADESNALQAQKNEIAGSVLMNPLDRMEVGADLPLKTRLGGQGEVLGEQHIQSYLINPLERTSGSIELPNQTGMLKNKIENPLERQQMIKETTKEHRELVRAAEEKIQLKNMLTELEGHKNAYIDEMVKYYEDNPGGKGVKQGGLGFDSDGNVASRYGRESLNPSWYQEYYAKYGSKPSKVRLREFAESQLEGSKDNPQGHADFIEIKSMIDNVKSILSGRNNKLQSGFDPTNGRFDNVNLKQVIKNVGDKLYDSAVSRILNKPERTRYSPRERQNFNPNNPVEYSLSKWDKVYQAMLDDKHPLSKLPDGKETYYKSRIANGKAYGVAEELLKREDIDSLEQILKPVKNDLTGFSEYLEAVHSVDQYTQGYKTAMSVEHMQRVMDSATPDMKQAQQKIVKYNNNLLEKLVDGGILTRESVNAMKEKYQNYVPFIRDFSDTDAMETFIKSKGNINVSNPIKKLKGSEREIVDPLESIIKNTYTFTNLAERNKVGQAFAKLAKNPEFDNIVIKIDGETTANPKLSQFTVWENGKKQAYQTTPELYRAMASLDAEGTNFVMRMIAAPASLLRAGATLTPDFMARNIVRDAIGAFVNTKGFIPGVDSFKGLKHAIKKDSTYWEWMREGGGMATMVGLDRNYLGTTVKQMRTKTIQEKLTTAINPKTAIELLRNFSEKSELATRIGVYESAIKRGAGPLEAIMESREASMDFGRSGTIGKNINNITAFFNASLQGTDKMIRTLSDPKTRGRAAFNIGLSIVLPSFVTWYMGKDDERIQRLPAWQKDLFWVIPTSGKGPGWDGLIRIPKPFEVGVFFGSGTERMLDWAYKKNPNAFKGYGGSVKDAITPSLIPTALIPLAEWWANKSYFSGQDVVPRREQGLPDKYQYGANTSSTAKMIGNLTNTSPRKIDNTIRGYTGGLGTKVTEGIDLIGDATGTISRNAPSKPITSMPVFSGFTATSYRNSQPMQDYYDAQKKAEQSIAEAKLTGEKADRTQQQNHSIITNSNKAMDAMHKEQRKIESDSKLTPDQKRSKIDDLQLRETRLAEAVLKKLK